MKEIILSFLSVIAVAFFVLHFFDFLVYRKFKSDLKTIADIRGKTQEDIIELLELISTVRGKTSGKSALQELVFVVGKSCPFTKDVLDSYINAYSIPGTICTEDELPFLFVKARVPNETETVP